MNCSHQAHVRCRRAGASGRPAVAARLLHDRLGGGRRRLHARRRTRSAPQAITTDTTGLNVGDAKVTVPGGEMPVYFARPANVANPPVILVAMEIFGLHEYIKDVTRRARQARRVRDRARLLFPQGRRSHQDHRDAASSCRIVNSKPDAELFADLDATVAWAKSQGGDTNRLGIMGFCRGGRTVWEYCRAQPGPEGRRRVLRLAGRPRRAEGDLAEEPDRSCARHEGAGARPLRRGRPGHSGHAGRGDEGGAARPPTRPSSSRSIRARRTASTPTTGRATARKRPRTPGTRCMAWFKKYKVLS